MIMKFKKIITCDKLDEKKFVAVMMFFSTLVLFKVGNITWFILLQFIYCLYSFYKYRKITFSDTPLISFIYLELILSILVGMIWNLQVSYKKSALFMGLMSMMTYVVFIYMNQLIKKDSETVVYIKKAFRWMVLIQLIWIPLQYVIYKMSGVDINNVIFVDLLHFTNDASFVRAWTWYPAGCCHHPAVIAPMLVIAFCLFEPLPMKLLVIFDSLICGSSTAFVGVLVAAVLTIFCEFVINGKRLENKKKIIFIIVLFFLIFILMFQSDIFDLVNERVVYLFTRLTGLSTDDSTSAHFQYYLDYINIFKRSNVFQILFGCGEGCSGMWASFIYGRYAELGNWSIECDIVNILVNRGIVGFILFYSFLISIIIKGWKFNKYYSIVVFAIVVQGLGYNVQWDYIILIELLFYLCIKYKIDFFDKKI